jgi:hypothetical protein
LFIHNSQGDQDPCFHPGSSLTYMEFGPDAPAKPSEAAMPGANLQALLSLSGSRA